MSTNQPYLLGIDQGTSGSRAIIIDDAGNMRGYGYRPLPRLYPQPDRVEQDPNVLSRGVAEAITAAIQEAGCRPDEIAGCGIACQRNTDFAWDIQTRQPLTHAITWQDLRTVPMLDEIMAWPRAEEYRQRLGYLPGPYSSALHLAWRMKHQDVIREAAKNKTLHLGLSAEWLIVSLGQPTGHQMDSSLVQAMGLYDFRAQDYWQEWLNYLGVPRDPLPVARPTLYNYGTLEITGGNATASVPVLALIGDQQSALFGYDCRHPGDAECTHGTASFIDVFLGQQMPQHEKLNVYNAWHLGDVQTYCLEADTTVTGAVVRWMHESARFFDRPEELGLLAGSVPDSGGVIFIPAFTGLNVPYNNRDARGTLLGMTLGTTRAHIARAFLESIAYQIRAIIETIQADTGLSITRLHVGGGLAASDEACQIQADLVGIPIIRPTFTETTARSAAMLAGIGGGIWKDEQALPPLPGQKRVFEPQLNTDRRDAGYANWEKAIQIACTPLSCN